MEINQLINSHDIHTNEDSPIQEEKQYVAFRLGHEEYAVDILYVQEIIRWADITRVPKAPAFVKGVLNLRGNVIPVIDAHIRLNLPEAQVTENSRIIVFNLDNIPVAMTIDYVTEVLLISEEQIEKSQSIQNSDRQFIIGIGKLDSRLLIILDIFKVLDMGLQQKKD